MKRQRKLSVALVTMLMIQTILVTGCTDNSDNITDITTEMTTENITQEEKIQTESEKLKDNNENNTQTGLPDIVQTINESDYKPFDIGFNEFVDGYNYFTKQFTDNYEPLQIKDENIDFYNTSETNNCNVYVIHIGDKVPLVDIVVYCSSEDKDKILSIEYFTNPIEDTMLIESELYVEITAGAIVSIVDTINMDICYDNEDEMDKVMDFIDSLFKELSKALEETKKSYRGYIYTVDSNFENKIIKFFIVKE